MNYEILSHNETPGLGDYANKEKFKSQFVGKGLENLSVVKNLEDNKHIQAITGATITSKALTKAINEAIEQAQEFEKTNK